VQYGPGVSAFAVYMTQYQLLPYQHTAEVFNELAGLGTSPGTLQRTVRMTATRPEVPVTAIRRALVAAPVAHADETGRRVNGATTACGCAPEHPWACQASPAETMGRATSCVASLAHPPRCSPQLRFPHHPPSTATALPPQKLSKN